MGGKIYVDRFDLNGITVFTVTSDPNGVLTAPIGSVAWRVDVGFAEIEYRNTDGGTTWVQAGGSGLDFTAVDFSDAGVVAVNQGGIDSTSLGLVSSITTLNADIGDIGGAVPDGPAWLFQIDAALDYASYDDVIVRARIGASTVADSVLLYTGLCDGNFLQARGVYGSVNLDTGATGSNNIGTTPVNGNGAATFLTGGNLSLTSLLDVDNSRARGQLVRSRADTGPAYGQIERTGNPNSWAGTELWGFIALGTTAIRAAATISGIEVDWLLVPRKT
jgi:hypothetical protein